MNDDECQERNKKIYLSKRSVGIELREFDHVIDVIEFFFERDRTRVIDIFFSKSSIAIEFFLL